MTAGPGRRLATRSASFARGHGQRPMACSERASISTTTTSWGRCRLKTRDGIDGELAAMSAGPGETMRCLPLHKPLPWQQGPCGGRASQPLHHRFRFVRVGDSSQRLHIAIEFAVLPDDRAQVRQFREGAVQLGAAGPEDGGDLRLSKTERDARVGLDASPWACRIAASRKRASRPARL